MNHNSKYAKPRLRFRPVFFSFQVSLFLLNLKGEKKKQRNSLQNFLHAYRFMCYYQYHRTSTFEFITFQNGPKTQDTNPEILSSVRPLTEKFASHSLPLSLFSSEGPLHSSLAQLCFPLKMLPESDSFSSKLTWIWLYISLQ